MALVQLASAADFLSETYDVSTSRLWNCGRCLLNGKTYVIDRSQNNGWYSTGSNWDADNMGRCCENDNIGS
jgi:hypothetical protein